MDGDKRRKEIMELLNTEKDPLSGTSLAKRLGVSRQVISTRYRTSACNE